MKIKEINHYLVMMTAFLLLVLASITFYHYNAVITEYGQEHSLVISVSTNFNHQLNCLAENIYYEAGSESYQGKLAVAQVTMNRLNSGEFADSVCGVVYQKVNRLCQFSWVCQPHPAPENLDAWNDSVVAARSALTEPFVSATLYKSNAMYYHADYVHPDWKLQRVATIGKHIFFKETDHTQQGI